MAEKDLNKIIADQAKEIARLKSERSKSERKEYADAKDYVKTLQDIATAQQEQIDNSKEYLETQNKIRDLQEKQNAAVAKGQKEQVNKLEELIEQERERLELLKRNRKFIKDGLKDLQESAKREKAAYIAMKGRNKLAEEYAESIKDSVSFIGNLSSSIEEIPVIGGVLAKSLQLDKIQKLVAKKLTDSFVQAAVPINGKGGMVAGLKGASSAVTGLLKKFGPLLAIAAALAVAVKSVEVALEVDKEVTSLAKNLGMSRDNAKELFHDLEHTVVATRVAGLNSEKLLESFEAIRASIGTTAGLTMEMAEAGVLLQQQFGLAGKEIGDFTLGASSAGMTTLEMAGNVKSMVASYNQMTGDSISHSDIMKDVAKTSKSVAARYGGFGPALIKATIQAKQLGLTLEETSNIADDLLSIEDSIGKEVKAQVLLNKSFNMDRARALALAGDTAGAAQEAVNQLNLSYGEFTKLDVIKQRAAAEAAGLTVDQLTNALQLEEYRKSLGVAELKSMKDLTQEQIKQLEVSGQLGPEQAEQLALQNQQAAVTERLTQLADRLKSIFASIVAGPVGSLLSSLVSVLEVGLKPIVFTLEVIGGAVSYITEGFKTLLPVIGTVAAAIALLNAKTIIGAIASGIKVAYDTFAGIPFVGFGLATAAALGVTGFISNQVKASESIEDGVIDSTGGLVVSGPKGSVQLDPKDSIVAGTDLGGGGGNNGSSDGSAIVKKLDQLISIVNQPVVVKIGDKVIRELDTAIALNRNYTARTGTTYGATQ